MVRRVLLLFAVVVGCVAGGPAEATVPSAEEGRVAILCTYQDRIVMQYREAFYGGGPRYQTYDWRRVMLDLGTWEGQVHDMGWVLTDTPWQDPRFGDVHEEHGDGDSHSIVESLAQWEMTGCFFMGTGYFMTPEPVPGDFQYELSDQGLTIGLEGRVRPIEDFALALPGTVDPPKRGCLRLLGHVRFVPTQPWPDVDEECAAERAQQRPLDRPLVPIGELELEQLLVEVERLEVLESIELWSKTVVLVQVSREYEEFPLLVVFDTTNLRPDKSFLTNAKGLDAHRRGEYEESRKLFESATMWDRDNETAQYNLACACARLGDIEAMITSLSALPATAELRSKIVADADFDGVREKFFYSKFMQALPAE